MLILLNRLKQYKPSNLKKKIRAKEETKRATTKLYINRQDVIKVFKTGVFPYIDGFKKNKNQKKNQKDLQRTKIRDEHNKFIEYVEDESKDVNYDFF